MTNYIPGVDLSQMVDGQTLGALWNFYSINVNHLETMTHEQFAAEFPNATRELERIKTLEAQREQDMQDIHAMRERMAELLNAVPHG